MAPLGKVDASLRRGESARVEVVVRTRKIGHFFPGGTVDAFDVWVELEATDSNGKTVFHSGEVTDGGKGPVEPGAHFYRSLLLDERGNPINKRNAWAARSLAYVRLIPPGAADTIHYRLRIPEDCGDTLTLRAKVNYRKFMWWNTQWAFAGVRDPEHKDFGLAKSYDDGRWVFTGDTSKVSGNVKAIPDLPITVMAEAKTELKILPQGAPAPERKPYLDKSVRERWNDYGIGLLLQGDLRGAEAAFLKVTEMEPGYADGFVNVARVRLQEGETAEAETFLRKALAIEPKLAEDPLLPRLGAQGAGPLRRGARAHAPGAGALPARPRRREPGGAAPVPEAPARRGDRRAPEGPRGRPGGPHGALQPDAGLPGSGKHRDGEEAPDALRALQGGRGGAVHHRPLPAAAPARQQRAPVDPRAPHAGAGSAAESVAFPGQLPRGAACRARDSHGRQGASDPQRTTAPGAAAPEAAASPRGRK